MRFDSPCLAFLLVVALSACSGGGTTNGGAVQADALTGLYEGGQGPRRNQLCLIEREGRSPSFGLIVWGSGDTNCSGRGVARREDDRLRLLLDGDESCALDARIEGGQISLPATIAPECARYYCGGDARMAGAVFERAGSTQADAQRAGDLVGDPLCGG